LYIKVIQKFLEELAILGVGDKRDIYFLHRTLERQM
jgi:hypothetical protein